MQVERGLGFEPVDRETDKLGYDVESRVPGTGKLRFIEVKGRVQGAPTVTVTKNEVLTSLNKPEDYILAIVEFLDGGTEQVHYLRRPFRREPDFGVTSINYDLPELLARAGDSTDLASSEAMVLRGAALPAEPPRPQESSGSDALRVDLEALAQGDLSQNVTLRHGDTVFVPRVAVAYVFGEVRKPGRYEIRDDTTVLHALTLAGGTTEFAAVNRVRIVRTVSGEQVEIPAELSDLVRPGDVVRVPERFF